MKKTTVNTKDALSWAGSNAGDGRRNDSPRFDSSGQDATKLHEIKHKLDDDQYVDGAVSKIASFLTDTLKKKGKNGK
ncbi:MAG: hypothetical protein LLF89_07125 [Spirochaetaceae bacterium]|nr:hypothetical protein [Spirochaetaceae bacterium]